MTDQTDRKGQLTKLGFRIFDWLDDAGLFRNCLTCAHWIEDENPMCGKYKMRPPTKIIVSGCEDHTDNIPF